MYNYDHHSPTAEKVSIPYPAFLTLPIYLPINLGSKVSEYEEYEKKRKKKVGKNFSLTN